MLDGKAFLSICEENISDIVDLTETYYQCSAPKTIQTGTHQVSSLVHLYYVNSEKDPHVVTRSHVPVHILKSLA